MVYYVAYLSHQTEDYQVVGWTDNKYIIEEFIRCDYWKSYGLDVMMYDCQSEKDFIDGVLKYYGVSDIEAHLFRLKVFSVSNDNEKTLIMSYAEIQNAIYDTNCVCDYISDALNSLITLSHIAKYIKDENVKTFIDYLRATYFRKLYRKYSQDFLPVSELVDNIINSHYIVYDCLYGVSNSGDNK